MQQSIFEKIAKLLCCATNLPERQENTIEDKREIRYDYDPKPEPQIPWNQIPSVEGSYTSLHTKHNDNGNQYVCISNSRETLESSTDGVFDIYQNPPMTVISEEQRARLREEYRFQNHKNKLTREKSISMTNLSAPKANKFPPTSNLMLIKSKSQFDILTRDETVPYDEIQAFCNSRGSQQTTGRSVDSENAHMPVSPIRPRYSAENQPNIGMYMQPKRTAPSPKIEPVVNYVAVNWEKTDQLRTESWLKKPHVIEKIF